MIGEILALVIEFAIQTVFLMIGLWIMIKIQKLNYKFVGLLGSAAIASGLDLIPFAGHYISSAVLLFCIFKVTRADHIDVVFTCAVGYALMFGMNLWLLGALLGDLRPSAQEAEASEIAGEFEAEDQNAAGTNHEGTATLVTNKPTARIAAIGKPKPSMTDKSVKELAGNFSLKGVTVNSTKSLVVVSAGGKTYTIGLGESLSVDTANGKMEVRCVKVDSDSAVMSVKGVDFKLFLQ